MTNTHELGVYQQQANIALQFTVAVRDKALEAYKEIMNMQILINGSNKVRWLNDLDKLLIE